MSTYIDRAWAALVRNLDGRLDADLMRLYTLLVVTRGADTTLRDVHDAWAVWRAFTRPDHPAIVPFDDLSPEVQALDEPYAAAIRAAAAER